jgi:DNA modification methylase
MIYSKSRIPEHLQHFFRPAEIGLEESPGEYVASLVEVFRQVRRVLRDDGTVWLNLGDSYSGSWGNQSHKPGVQETSPIGQVHDERFPAGPRTGAIRPGDPPAKNLRGMPWRVAFALQDDGWILRSPIVWRKPNAMPESVTDRPSCTYELVFLLAKRPRYWFDLDAIREPLARPEALDEGIVFGGRNGGEGKVGSAARRGGEHGSVYGGKGHGHTRPQTGKEADPGHRQVSTGGRNPGDVWTISTTSYAGAHFAVMPPELVRRCVLAGCPEGGTVLDPFIGSGTVAMVANQMGRRAVGIDLSETYLDLAMQRCKDAPLDFTGTEAS